jgi:hypothetical protein
VGNVDLVGAALGMDIFHGWRFLAELAICVVAVAALRAGYARISARD